MPQLFGTAPCSLQYDPPHQSGRRCPCGSTHRARGRDVQPTQQRRGPGIASHRRSVLPQSAFWKVSSRNRNCGSGISASTLRRPRNCALFRRSSPTSTRSARRPESAESPRFLAEHGRWSLLSNSTREHAPFRTTNYNRCRRPLALRIPSNFNALIGRSRRSTCWTCWARFIHMPAISSFVRTPTALHWPLLDKS